jgi:hypothetical protein
MSRRTMTGKNAAGFADSATADCHHPPFIAPLAVHGRGGGVPM